MAMNFRASRLEPKPHCNILLHRHNTHISTSKLCNPSHLRTLTAHSGGGVAEEESSGSLSGSAPPSARAQLDLLEQLTSTASPVTGGYESEGSSGQWRGTTIRDQLVQLADGWDGDFSIALGKKNLKKVSSKFQTISQKRNIRRQAYLNEVSRRNDSVFFATIGAGSSM
ncbi:hypothetical protein Dimus_019511 [Dionaea muscipula]